jgi:Trypsin
MMHRSLAPRTTLFLTTVGWIFLAPFGFVQETRAEDDVRTKVAPIFGGQPSEREAVVFIATNLDDDASTDDRACTGAIISPSLVLTARHCVSAFTEGTFSCTIQGGIDESSRRSPPGAGAVGFPYDPDWIRVYLGPSGPASADKDSPDALRVARIFTVETTEICRNDIAIIELEEKTAIEPLALRLGSGVFPQDRTKLIGYGINDDANNSQHEVDDVRIIGVGPSEFFPLEGQAPPRTFSVGLGPCPGDSGGPALSSETEAILGVFSFFRGDCTSTAVYNYYTQVSPYADFILAALEEVGEEPTLEEGESPAGSGGSLGLGGAPSGGRAGQVGGALGGSADGGSSAKKGGCTFGAGCGDPSGRAFSWGAPFLALGYRRWVRRRRLNG